jgi:GTP-binding protein
MKLWSASKFRTLPLSSIEPEVAFLGRSNVGKSSLLNAIMGQEICWTSAHPGRTREMNAFGIGGTKGGESKIVLLDMPGYGKASRAEWGSEILKYLRGRKQYVSRSEFLLYWTFLLYATANGRFSRLRRAFLLIDTLHGLKDLDRDILALFRQHAIPHQIILSKVDRVLSKDGNSKSLKSGVTQARLQTLREILYGLKPAVQPDARVEGPGALGEILTCSAETQIDGTKQPLGVSAIRWSILTAAGFDGSLEAKPSTMPSEVTSSLTKSTVAV